ncbi:MAG: AEC family transporter [Clostridiales bacterium]|nr:AEC family transporter [Clostridiales bacterium]
MPALLFSFLQMTVLIILGFVLRKTRVIDERVQQGLSNILIHAVLPFNLISSSQYEYSREMILALIAVAGASLCYFTFSIIGMRFFVKNIKMEDQERRVVIMTSIFMNTGFVGFPLMQALFGEKGMLLASCYNMVFNIFMYTYGEHKLSRKKANARNLLLNPVTLATIAALILFIIPWRMPGHVKETIDIVGNMTVPLAMIIIGSTLTTVNIKKLFTDKLSYFSTALRLIIFPAIMLGAVIIVRHYVYIMPVTATTIVIMTALPCGSMNVIFSEKFNCAPKLCARNFAQTVVLMIVTIPVFLAICTHLFGN